MVRHTFRDSFPYSLYDRRTKPTIGRAQSREDLMSTLRYTLAALVVLVTAGCTTPGSPPPGSPPRSLTITISSGLEVTPYSPEQLEDPDIRFSIEQCEKVGGDHCGSGTEPIDIRNEFRMGEDSSVYTVVKLGGVAPNRTYEVEWRLFDPDDGLLARFLLAQQTPSAWRDDYTLDYTFQWTPEFKPMWYPGKWRVEILVNGYKEGDRYFYVRDDE